MAVGETRPGEQAQIRADLLLQIEADPGMAGVAFHAQDVRRPSCRRLLIERRRIGPHVRAAEIAGKLQGAGLTPQVKAALALGNGLKLAKA